MDTYILDTGPLDLWFANIFSQFVAYHSTFLLRSFAEQIFSLDETHIIPFSFLMDFNFGVKLKNSLNSPVSQTFFLTVF